MVLQFDVDLANREEVALEGLHLAHDVFLFWRGKAERLKAVFDLVMDVCDVFANGFFDDGKETPEILAFARQSPPPIDATVKVDQANRF